MPVFEKQSPYDNWERFKLPWYMRLSLFLLTKQEKKDIIRRIDSINRIRKREKKESIEKFRKMVRPKPQKINENRKN